MSRILTITVMLTPTRYESVGNPADEVNKSRRGGQIVFQSDYDYAYAYKICTHMVGGEKVWIIFIIYNKKI